MYKLSNDLIKWYKEDNKRLELRKNALFAIFLVECKKMTNEIKESFEHCWKVSWSSGLMFEEKDIKKILKKYES